MYKGLYDKFKNWFHGGQVYFYSDPHLAEEEMKYIRHNYIGDEEQIKRINSKIGKNDTLVILGDIGDINWVKKIRGYKVLIQGNHDAGATKYERVKLKVWDEEKEKFIVKDNYLFDEVYEGCLMISDKIILSHEPIGFKYALNIHGHDHSNREEKELGKQYLNVCAEHIDYTPVCLKDIIKSGKLKNIPDVHRETIDTATKKKLQKKLKEH